MSTMYESTINEPSTVSITDSKEGPIPGEDSICGIKEIATLPEEVDMKEKDSLITERIACTDHTADCSTSDASIEEEPEPAAPVTDVEVSVESCGEIEAVQEAKIPTEDLPHVTEVIEEHPHNLIGDDVKKESSDNDEGEELKDDASAGELETEKNKGDGEEGIEVANDGETEIDDFVEGIRDVNETNSLIDEGIAPEPAESACVGIASEDDLFEENEVTRELSNTSTGAILPSNVSIEGYNDEESAPIEASDQNADNSNDDCPPDIFTELDETPNLLKSWQLQKDNNNTACEEEKPKLDVSPPAAPQPVDSEPELLRGWSREGGREEGGFARMARKAGVAVTGGALVLAGLPMIPMPTPGGVVVVGAGLAVLATEFPAAQRALDRSRQGLTDLVGDESDDDEEKKEKKKKNAKIADLVFEDEGAAKKKMTKNRVKHILNPMSGRRGQSTFNNDDFNEMRDKTVNAAKGAKKNMKKFVRGTVLPLMERMTSSSRSITSSKSDSTSKHTLRLGSQGVVKPPLFIRTPQITIQEKASNGTGIHEC